MTARLSTCCLVLACFLACAHVTTADEADGDEVFQLDNGCTITRRPVNSTAPPIPWYGMPLPHLNCSGAGLTRLSVEGMVEDTKSITLSYNDLIEFHVDDLEPFPKVEKLELKVNKLTRVLPSQRNPKLIMNSLTYISLSHNQISDIPNEALKSFPNLKFFIMFSNALKTVRRDEFRYNKKIEFLYLGPNPIETFEDDFLANMNLTGLGLRSCGLTRVPPHIGAMTKLVYLDISVNKLTRLEPNTFRDCQQLRWLELSSNSISSVDPLAFKGAYKLSMIDMSDNLIATIPNGTFADMSTERVEIDLYENPINCDCGNAWLKDWYDKLVENDMSTELRLKCEQPLRNHGKKSYQLQQSDFTCRSDDQQWQDCGALQPTPTGSTTTETTTPTVDDATLCPDGCVCFDENGQQYGQPNGQQQPPTRVRGRFGYMKNTQLSVNCKAANLNRIPFEKIRSDVRKIMLSDNNIATLRMSELKKFKDLMVLDLRRNNIKTIVPDAAAVLSSVTVLNLRFNNLTSVTKDHFKSFPNLKIVMLYHNKIVTFPSDLFVNNPNLNRVYLGPNPTKNFKLNFLGNVDIYSLSLRNMSLTEVPKEIANMKNLTFLDVSDNRITKLPNRTFSDATALYRLVLENNKISKVEVNAFNGASLLQSIYLSENQIKSLPNGIFANVSQERLKVELWSNPMVCDCNLKWFKTFIEDREEDDPTTDIRFVCDSPVRVHNKKSDQMSPDEFVCAGGDDKDATGAVPASCPACKKPVGPIALAVVLTFITTLVCCFVAWRCTFKRRYSELLQYAKHRDNFEQMDDM